MKFGKKAALSAAGLSAALTALTAMPASAQLTGTDANLGTCGAFFGGVQQTCQGVGQKLIPIGTGSDTIRFTCTVVTPGATASMTTGVGCFLRGVERGDVHWAPSAWTIGATSTTEGLADSGLVSQSYQLCTGGGYTNNGVSTGLINYICTNPL